MITESLDRAGEHPRNQSPEQKTIKIYPEISLEQEWQRQAKRLIELGFHKECNLTEEEYLESLPKFTPQPESFKGRLDTPVLVDPRINPKRQSELAGILYLSNRFGVKDWDKDPKKYKTPNLPYTVWTDEGRRNMNKKMQDVRKKLAPDERVGTEYDGIALCIARPNILKKRFLDLPGSEIAPGVSISPCLVLWDGRPLLSYRFSIMPNPKYGSLVCGRQK